MKVGKASMSSDLKKILSWCAKRSISVTFSNTAENYRDGSEIVISGRMSERRKVVYLLHECGHWLIDSKKECKRFGTGYPSQHLSRVNKTFSYRSSVVFEELEAWKRGWDLGKRLKVRVTKEFFENQKSKALKLYFEWALAPKKFEKEDEEE